MAIEHFSKNLCVVVIINSTCRGNYRRLGRNSGDLSTMYGPGDQSGGAPGSGYSTVISLAQTESAYGSSLTGGKPNRPARDGPKERRSTPRGQMSASSDSKPSLAALDNALKEHFKEPAPLAKITPIPTKKMGVYYSGIAGLLGEFEKSPPPAPTFPISIENERLKRRRAKVLENEKLVQERIKQYVPPDSSVATKEAYSTLFLANLMGDMTSSRLQSFMEEYGEIVHVRVVTDLEGKSKRYAFVEFKYEEDMKAAYHKVKQQGLGEARDKVVVDVERGRTTQNWRPMKLGGGLGGRVMRKSRKDARYEKFEKLLLEKKMPQQELVNMGVGEVQQIEEALVWDGLVEGEATMTVVTRVGTLATGEIEAGVVVAGGRIDVMMVATTAEEEDMIEIGSVVDIALGGVVEGHIVMVVGVTDAGGGGYGDRGDRDGDSRGFAGKSAGIYGAGGARSGGGDGERDRRERSRSRDRSERRYYGGY